MNFINKVVLSNVAKTDREGSQTFNGKIYLN